MLDWNGYWHGGLNDEEQLVIQELVAEIERQHGALVEEERLLEAGRKPADERFAVATPGGEPWKRSLIAYRHVLPVNKLPASFKKSPVLSPLFLVRRRARGAPWRQALVVVSWPNDMGRGVRLE